MWSTGGVTPWFQISTFMSTLQIMKYSISPCVVEQKEGRLSLKPFVVLKRTVPNR